MAFRFAARFAARLARHKVFQERLQEAMARRHNRIEREPRLSQCAPNVVLARFHSTLGAPLWANARLYYQTKNLGWVRPWVFFMIITIRPHTATVVPEVTPRAPWEPQDGPRSPQDGPRWPRDGPKTAPDGPKMAHDGPNGRPRVVHDGPHMVHRAPRAPQDAARQPFGPLNLRLTSRRPQNEPNMAPRSAPEAPKS